MKEMRNNCPYCGNNPVPHFSTWFNSSFNTMMRPLHRENTSFLQIFASYAATYFIHALFATLRFLGAATLSIDPADAISSRGKVLWEEARRRGIPFHGIKILGRQTDAYTVVIGGRRLYFVSLPRPVYGETTAEWWLDDKAILKEKLARSGVAVPQGGAYTRWSMIERAFEQLAKPVIVKPRIGSRGRHTTTHVHTKEELRKAYLVAKQLCHWVVMEEHLVGSVYRGTMIDGKLTGVLAGDPPRVVGDGTHTIYELVPIKNQLRHAKVSPVALDERHRAFLARTGRSFDTVPQMGEVVDLLEKIGVSYGGHSAEVTDITHPLIKETLEQAAAAVGDPIIGFDFIIADITRDPREQKWGIIEGNSTPFINLHHDPVEGVPVNVAAHVWDFVERNIRRF